MYYLTQNQDRMKRTVAAMCIDSPAAGRIWRVTSILNPHAANPTRMLWSFGSAESITPRGTGPGARSSTAAPTTTISATTPSAFRLWCRTAGAAVLARHNSYDTPATLDPKSLRDLMVMNAAYTYVIALRRSRGEALDGGSGADSRLLPVASSAVKVLDQVAAATDSDSLGRLLCQGREHIAYSLDRESQSVRWVWDLKEGLADLAAFADEPKARLDRAVRDRAMLTGLGQIQPLMPPKNPEAEKIAMRAEAHGHHYHRPSAAVPVRGLPCCELPGRSRLRALLVRRKARIGRGHPADGA